MIGREWWQLTAAWGAFVFLPFNLFAGTLISKGFGATDAVLGLICGSAILLSLTVPAVLYASITGRTYAEAIDEEITNEPIRFALKLLVPLVNIGWFAIQTIAATHIVRPGQEGLSMFFWYAGMATIFIAGPLLRGYTWLYRSGMVAIVAMMGAMVVIVLTGTPQEMSWGSPVFGKVSDAALLVVGTWIFSSTTCVMDVARSLRHPGKAVTAVLVGTVAADLGLLLVGFFYPDSASVFLSETEGSKLFGILAGFFMIIALWSTNDSNFFSTEKALQRLGVPSKYTAIAVVLLTGCIGTIVGRDLFSLIGGWLQLMGWIGIPMGLFWLVKVRLIKRR